jgi:hypothetical protein
MLEEVTGGDTGGITLEDQGPEEGRWTEDRRLVHLDELE